MEENLLDHIAGDQVKKGQGDNPESIINTFLSRRLGNLIGISGIDVAETRLFCWTNPTEYGLMLEGDASPLPGPLNQRKTGHCIAYAISRLVKLQMNIIARLSNGEIQEVPEIPLRYFVSVYLRLAEPMRNISDMLDVLHTEGFVARESCHEIVGLDVQRFYIHFCLGMQRLDFEEENNIMEFNTRLKRYILSYGGVLGELILNKNYDYSGKTIASRGGRKTASVSVQMGGEQRDLGHAVLIVGCKNVKNTVHYKYLNSYGATFGEAGIGWAKSDAFYHVYVPQVLKW